MATYAAIDDVRAYTDLAEGVSDEDLEKVLDRAELDIDGELTTPDPRPDSGAKYDPAALESWRATALNRGVCAQTEYRLAMGEEFFIRAQHSRVSGPDFTTEGRLPYIGPKARRELAGARLLRARPVSIPLANPYTDVADPIDDVLLP